MSTEVCNIHRQSLPSLYQALQPFLVAVGSSSSSIVYFEERVAESRTLMINK